MAQRSRHLLFTADPSRPLLTDGELLPRPTRTTAIWLLWSGLSVMLVLLVGVLLLWHGRG